jgi:DNA polymerase III epsilon subunit-like protein
MTNQTDMPDDDQRCSTLADASTGGTDSPALLCPMCQTDRSNLPRLATHLKVHHKLAAPDAMALAHNAVKAAKDKATDSLPKRISLAMKDADIAEIYREERTAKAMDRILDLSESFPELPPDFVDQDHDGLG